MDQVVGVSHECDFPTEAKERPRVTRCAVHGAELTSRDVDEWVRRALHDNGSIYTIDASSGFTVWSAMTTYGTGGISSTPAID